MRVRLEAQRAERWRRALRRLSEIHGVDYEGQTDHRDRG
jgi:hypothetical protein